MEQKILSLEEQNQKLQKQLEYNQHKEEALQKVLFNYDNLLKEVIIEKNNLQQNDAMSHVANLESAFYDLLQKYEKAKLLVQGFQENESVLKKQVMEYENILETLRSKFVTYKSASAGNTQTKSEIYLKKAISCDNCKGKNKRLMTTI